jgi:DNA-binding PadR family transcriptional regulator
VLLADLEGWRHGYDLSRETDLRSGTLYPILMRLERQGWLEARWEESPAAGKPRRHLYRLSAAGAREARAMIARGRGDVRVVRRANVEGVAD